MLYQNVKTSLFDDEGVLVQITINSLCRKLYNIEFIIPWLITISNFHELFTNFSWLACSGDIYFLHDPQTFVGLRMLTLISVMWRVLYIPASTSLHLCHIYFIVLTKCVIIWRLPTIYYIMFHYTQWRLQQLWIMNAITAYLDWFGIIFPRLFMGTELTIFLLEFYIRSSLTILLT